MEIAQGTMERNTKRHPSTLIRTCNSHVLPTKPCGHIVSDTNRTFSGKRRADGAVAAAMTAVTTFQLFIQFLIKRERIFIPILDLSTPSTLQNGGQIQH